MSEQQRQVELAIRHGVLTLARYVEFLSGPAVDYLYTVFEVFEVFEALNNLKDRLSDQGLSDGTPERS